MCYFIIPIGLIILSMFIMKTMYKLDYIFPQIHAELDQRNAAAAKKEQLSLLQRQHQYLNL